MGSPDSDSRVMDRCYRPPVRWPPGRRYPDRVMRVSSSPSPPLRVAAVLATAATLTLYGVPAGAASRSAVGGPELDTHGVAVDLTGGIPAPPMPRASSYLIADLDTGAVLAARDPHGRYAPASCLKIL